MTYSRATALLICMHFTTKSEAFHTGQAGLAQTNTITITRLPTEVKYTYNVDDPIQLNIPSSMQPPEKDSSAPDRPLAGKVNHRHSSRDWIHNVASIPSSSVLREIMNPVLSITVWSTFVSIIYRVMTNTKSTFWNQFALSMCIPTQIHSFLVSSLGLLLVFRTNSAYQRFVVSTVYNSCQIFSQNSFLLEFFLIHLLLIDDRKEDEFGNKYYQPHGTFQE